ncbi:nuclear pore complex assembly-domain-containing protein [Cytidiella melzeri]|nr:nuclear pore complex assembly-domain-containing protein [Cytidiella melzeri]
MDPDTAEFELVQLFDLAPETFPWRSPIPRQIEQRRAAMADVLIFDILLSAGGIRHPDSLYPPRDELKLRDLLDAIEETTYDGLKKDCLIYFLLKWHKDGREERFQEDRCIPPQFVALADAYWFLDSGEDVPRAISLLSDARLIRDYTSKIIQAIGLEQNNANALVLQYIRAAKPLLTEPNDIDAYSIALAESSLLEAWQYQRTFSEAGAIRPRVLRNVLRWCLSPKPRAKPLTQLLAFPLSNYEQSQLHEFALRPPSDIPASSISVIQDLACVRLIHGGQLAAAVKLDRQFAITPVRGSFGGKAAQDRKQTMDEIMSVMPAAEKLLLELELEQMSQSADTSTFLNGSVTDLDMSWEHIRPPLSNGASSSKPVPVRPASRAEPLVPPISQRSGGPRFGGPIPQKSSVSSAFTAARNMFNSSTQPAPQPLVHSDTAPILSSIKAPSTGQLPSEFVASQKRKEPVSLFDSMGSANKVPNAFYQVPSVFAGSKRPLPEETSSARSSIHPADISNGSALDVSAMLHQESDTDIDMHKSEVDVDSSSRLEHNGMGDSSPEFAVSVFGSRRPELSSGIVQTSITRSKSPEAPPGAFEPDSDDGNVQEEATSGTMLLDELDTPPRQPPRKSRPSPPTRRARAPPMTKEPSLSHSVPGAFIPDEEDDFVPPLPPVTPSIRRQTRKIRPKAEESISEEAAPRQTRRSSRLSVMSPSSAGSSSPEPPSPEKRTRAKSTRQPTSGTSRIPRARRQR